MHTWTHVASRTMMNALCKKVIEDHYVRPTKSHRKFTRICKFNDNCFMCFNQAYVNSTIIVSFVSTSNIVAKHLHMLYERWYDEIRVGSYCYFVFMCGRRGLYIVHLCLIRSSGGYRCNGLHLHMYIHPHMCKTAVATAEAH